MMNQPMFNIGDLVLCDLHANKGRIWHVSDIKFIPDIFEFDYYLESKGELSIINGFNFAISILTKIDLNSITELERILYNLED
jgi:hypothetical protein